MSPCEWLKMADGTAVHINRRRGSKRVTCKFCGVTYNRDDGKLCDFPVGNGRTCDAAMCRACARTLGSQATVIGNGIKKLNDTIDVCPIHRGQAIVRDGKIEAENA